MQNIYLYDNTFDGLLTSIFDAWTDSSFHGIRAFRDNTEVSLIENLITINTDRDKAIRICNWIERTIGIEALRQIYKVFLTETKDCGKVIFNYLKLASKEGKKINMNLTNLHVISFLKLDRRFTNETHRMHGYTRFEVLDNNILYAQIEPEFNQLEIIAPFFADRYYGNPWIIHDLKRKNAAIFDGKRFIITEVDDTLPLNTTKHENSYKKLWVNYLKSVTIEQRINLKLQQQNMPLKYRSCVTEFL